MGLEEATIPIRFALDQNFPNPFNSATVITFVVPKAGETTLELFDLLGQKVATLASGYREAGPHTFAWDGRNDKGRPLASGMYLYRLQSGRSKVATRKMLVLR